MVWSEPWYLLPSQTFPIPWDFLHFSVLWEIYLETHAFPICWSIPKDGNRMGKKAPMLWEKYDYQFHSLASNYGFCCISLYCGKFMGKPIHLQYAEVYHRMGIKAPMLWEKYYFSGFPQSLKILESPGIFNIFLKILEMSRYFQNIF